MLLALLPQPCFAAPTLRAFREAAGADYASFQVIAVDEAQFFPGEILCAHVLSHFQAPCCSRAISSCRQSLPLLQPAGTAQRSPCTASTHDACVSTHLFILCTACRPARLLQPRGRPRRQAAGAGGAGRRLPAQALWPGGWWLMNRWGIRAMGGRIRRLPAQALWPSGVGWVLLGERSCLNAAGCSLVVGYAPWRGLGPNTIACFPSRFLSAGAGPAAHG